MIGKDLSIVVPLLNEEDNLDKLYALLKEVITELNVSYEIIFVDDGSTDNSFEKIKSLSLKDVNVKGISLSRNFGHQVALSTGLSNSKGKAVITMDADLQHPPALIKNMYAEFMKGYDIVNTLRKETADGSFMKNLSSHFFYKLINFLSEVKIETGAADFRLMSRKATDAYLLFTEKDKFTRGLVSWLGFKQVAISYEAPARYSGKTKYTYRKMFSFALDGITSFSSRPLRISFYVGLMIAMAGLVYAGFAVVMHLKGNTTEGWTSILVTVIFLGGIQLISIGILGEYIGRIFREAKGRPLYFIKDQTFNQE